MVKKIKYIEEEKTEEALDQADYQSKMLEYMHGIDYKMWEMFKVTMAWAEREGLLPEDEEAKKPVSPDATDVPELDIDIDSIILGDDDL